MAVLYPGTIDTTTQLPQPSGTSTLDSPDHAGAHTNESLAIIALENTVGTTLGTNVLKNFAAGDFAARINAQGTLQQTIIGTVNNATFGTPAITGGTINSATINNATVATATISAGTFTGGISLSANGSIMQTGAADHIYLVPGASKFVKTTVNRQDNGTSVYQGNQVIQSGWGFVTSDATSNPITKTVTFGTPFGQIPIVVVCCPGYKNNSDPTSAGDFTTSADLVATGGSANGTSFTASLYRIPGTVANTYRFGFTWIAMGSF